MKALASNSSFVGGLTMDAIAKTKQPTEQSSPHSHVVRPANMEWQKTRFPGCEVKTLLFDRASGLVTALMRMQATTRRAGAPRRIRIDSLLPV
jgi:hypothetical protein